MNEHLKLKIAQYKNKFVLLDTNILLVYLVGCVNPQLIATFKRAKCRYCVDDFNILNEFLSHFTKFTTTPNILTEVSNLGAQLNGDAKENFFWLLSQFIQKTTEEYIPSVEISKDVLFIQFGITDRGILELAKTDCLIITDDFRLSDKYFKDNSINFNHLRNYVD